MDHPTFSARLRARRRELDITQEELGRRIGTTAAMLSHYERGRRMPMLGTCAALAEALGVSLDWLVRGVEGPTAAPGAPERGDSAEGA